MTILRDSYTQGSTQVSAPTYVEGAASSEAQMLATAYSNLMLSQGDLQMAGENFERARERYYEYRVAYAKAKAIADDVLAQNAPNDAIPPPGVPVQNVAGDTEPSFIQRQRSERERAASGYR